ncbi:hypothetical protein [Polaromonas sp. YR568]|uniref:hypothetical protein n=1 Tax=Polaromonas sp. YR568 TaxID=1855301 RepID=UPI0031383853
MKTVIAVLLGLAFLPLALFNARLIFRRSQPPKHRPLVFIFGGGFFILIGVLPAYLAYSGIQLESVHCVIKSCSVHQLADQAFAYWVSIVFWYVLAAFFVGLGLGQIRLCSRGGGGEP